ncbi:MAG: hypothetical protein ACYTE8_09240 [Planctomycetota bacterium]
MKNIEGRIKIIEKKLQVNDKVDNESILIQLVHPRGSYLTLPEPVEQWLTYQAALAKGSDPIILTAEDELKTRKETGRTDLNIEGIINWIDIK